MKIPPIPLVAAPETQEAREAVGFAYADPEVGKRHRIGGEPQWIRSDETPSCGCGKKMRFYAQLDSVGDRFCLADCALIYVFVCWDCFETKSSLQSG